MTHNYTAVTHGGAVPSRLSYDSSVGYEYPYLTGI